MRPFRELTEAVAALRRLQRSRGSKLVHDQRFRRELQKLEAVEKGGPLARRDVTRSVAVICRVLCDEFLKVGSLTN